MKVAVLTVSDRSSKGLRPDAGGPAVARAARGRGWRVEETAVVPDSKPRIVRALRRWSSGEAAMDLVLTTGGTGVSPRDVTPEATLSAIDKEIPGLSERMRRDGERFTPTAALSRAVCGIRGRTIIVNLPGSPKGAVESLDAVADLLPHARRMLDGAGH